MESMPSSGNTISVFAASVTFIPDQPKSNFVVKQTIWSVMHRLHAYSHISHAENMLYIAQDCSIVRRHVAELKCNEWLVFQPAILHCKVILSRGLSGVMEWIWVCIVPLVQDKSLNILTICPGRTTVPRTPHGMFLNLYLIIVLNLLSCRPLLFRSFDHTMTPERGENFYLLVTANYLYIENLLAIVN